MTYIFKVLNYYDNEFISNFRYRKIVSDLGFLKDFLTIKTKIKTVKRMCYNWEKSYNGTLKDLNDFSVIT